MLKILALDTSTDSCTISLSYNNVIKTLTHIEPKKHTQILLPMINTLLSEANLSLKDCDAFAVGRGPGSFTGIRIACSVIQGFSFALNKPIIAISTLRTIAQGAYRKQRAEHVLAVLDARMQEVYGGYFKKDDEGVMQLHGDEFIKRRAELENNKVLENNKKDPDKVHHKMSQKMPQDNKLHSEWPIVEVLPEAEDMIIIAEQEYKLGNVLTAQDLEPIYMRDAIVNK